MRKMKSLVDFKLSDNPLTSPPASVSISNHDSSVFSLKRSNLLPAIYIPTLFPRILSNKTVRDVTSIELPFHNHRLPTELIAKPMPFASYLIRDFIWIHESVSCRSKTFNIILYIAGRQQDAKETRDIFPSRIPVSYAKVLTAGFSYAFAGERTFSSTWRGRQRNTRGPEAVERGGHLWTQEVMRRWIRGRIDGITSTVDTAPATVSTSVGPKRSTARLVSPSLSWSFRYRYISCTHSTATSSRSYSANPPPNCPRISDPVRSYE